MFSLTNVKKPRVLLCVRSNMLKKTVGFTAFLLKHVEKALVLLCFRSKRLKNQWFYGKIMVNMQKVKKTIGFTVNN